MEEPASRRSKPAERIGTAYAAWLLAARTGEARYRTFALESYDRFLGEKVDHDFHVSRPFGLLTLRLHEAGVLSGERRQRARERALERIVWFLDRRRTDEALFDCNIALADTLAAACLARAFADDPALRADEVRRRVAGLGRRILETGDLNENASNYASLGICFFLELARLEGWTDGIARSPHFRILFERMRDLISPAGSIPEYGDGYFRNRQLRLDFVLLLEMAARLYDDASFQRAARGFLAAAPDFEEDQLNRAHMLLELDPFAPTRESRPVLSSVQTRRIPGPPVATVPDKLILRTGDRPGAAMVLVDLYAEGSHAHEYKRGSVGYYEAGGVPLFHNLGRRGTRSGQCGNTFWILDDATAFPGHRKEKVWNTMTAPARYCPAGGAPGEFRIADSLLLRNFPTRDLHFLRFDNLRLEGPRGTLLLDGFESPASWHGNVAKHPGTKLESSRDRTQGEFSQQVNWAIFGEQYCTRNLEEKKVRNTTFRLADYDTVKFDYQYEGRHPHCNLRALFEQWIDLGDRPLHAEVAHAEAHPLDGDAWGGIDFTSYITAGSGLKRRIVLTREGALVIVDEFTPGPEADGWAGGQLWQLYTLAERGDDWFASASDGAYAQADGSTSERRMLVKFLKTPGVAAGAERVRPAAMHAPRADGTGHQEFFTTWSRQPLAAGRTVVTAMAVLPLRTDAIAAREADRIAFEVRRGPEAQVTIAPSATEPRVTVRITPRIATVKRE
jgi:hypothetical protein